MGSKKRTQKMRATMKSSPTDIQMAVEDMERHWEEVFIILGKKSASTDRLFALANKLFDEKSNALGLLLLYKILLVMDENQTVKQKKTVRVKVTRKSAAC